MKWNKKLIILVIIVLLVLICLCDARKRRIPSRLTKKVSKTNRNTKLPKLKNQKQLLYETRETSPPNFITLLLFRLIYGIATQMGLEERLPSFIAPPNADESDYGFFSAPFGGDDDYDLGL
ncbi:hypothetical protein PVAND_012080 [Polypedilum vanderplanki]|uniref:Uncharacterized protein n=1 Tax=Polypedilum vanderplanki TaxID=319348 RepID=A0A9J6CM89_POLVA|nr:hypothetical protein PVAND_012080 [Polypedilum vanderplanki]